MHFLDHAAYIFFTKAISSCEYHYTAYVGKRKKNSAIY